MKSVMSYVNSFTESNEWFSVRINYPTDSLSIEIIFPKGSEVSSAETKCFFEEETNEEEKPALLRRQHKVRVVWRKLAPKTGAEYRVCWKWRPSPTHETAKAE
jgi:hypothetical protein